MINEMLSKAKAIQALARLSGLDNRPDYHFNNREIQYGENLSPEIREAMKNNSEVFLLRKEDNTVYGYLLTDEYGIIRDYKVK